MRPIKVGSVAIETEEMPIKLLILLNAGTSHEIATLAHQSRRLNDELQNSTPVEVPDAGRLVHHKAGLSAEQSGRGT